MVLSLRLSYSVVTRRLFNLWLVSTLRSHQISRNYFSLNFLMLDPTLPYLLEQPSLGFYIAAEWEGGR
jgi:hypothetical protein